MRSPADILTRSAHIEKDPPEIQADRDKLCRTLVNLLGNAVRFTPRDGQVSINASAVPGELRISVTDTGEGVPREAFSRIFEKFGQAEERREGRLRSTGLGLTFCKLAVGAHGGRIWMESEPGAGRYLHAGPSPSERCAEGAAESSAGPAGRKP